MSAEVAEEKERRHLTEVKKQKAEIGKAKAQLPRMTRAQLKASNDEAAWEDIDEWNAIKNPTMIDCKLKENPTIFAYNQVPLGEIIDGQSKLGR